MNQLLRSVALVALVSVGPGCGVFTQYQKEVVVTKDGEGKVLSVVITERIYQPENVAHPMVFEYIKLSPLNAPSQQPTQTPTGKPSP